MAAIQCLSSNANFYDFDSPEAHYQRRFRRRGKTPCASSTPGNDVTNAILHRWEKKKGSETRKNPHSSALILRAASLRHRGPRGTGAALTCGMIQTVQRSNYGHLEGGVSEAQSCTDTRQTTPTTAAPRLLPSLPRSRDHAVRDAAFNY